MPNTIGLITKYGAEQLDEIFMEASASAVLEADHSLLKFINAKTVMIPDIMMDGLGDYSRSGGYPEGDVTLTWTPYTLDMDRGRSFSIDSMDDEESAGLAFGKLSGEFCRTKVVPEVDAYRFSTLLANAKDANVKKSDTITASNIITRYNEEAKTLHDSEINPAECIRFISTEEDKLLKESTALEKKISQADYRSTAGLSFKVKMYDDMPIFVVPLTRFKSAYDFGAKGFTPAEGSCEINHLVVHRNAAICIKKHEKIKVFSPDVNQQADAWKYQYRLYHGVFTPKNKQDGILASIKGATIKTVAQSS